MISIKPITPRAFQSSIYRDEIKRAALDVRNGMVGDYKKTYDTWEHKPTFGSKVDTFQGEVRIQVATDDPVYGYVDLGTKKHKIPKRPMPKGKFLWFQRGKYKAKTKPKKIGSTQGGPTGKFVPAKQVTHPGTKARKFTQTIQKKWKPEFTKRMNAAMKAFAKRTGHGA